MNQRIITPGENYKGLDDWIRKTSCKKILMVCDGSIWYQKAFNAHLEEYDKLGVEIIGFRDFQPNPLYENVLDGVKLFREGKCDAIIAVGGGSAMDVAKCIKLYGNLPGEGAEGSWLTAEYDANDIPFLAMPTTAGTGSEATRFAVIYYDGKVEYKNDNHMVREEIIQHIVKASGEDPIVSTTGKASRELFETRVAYRQSHKYDFLTVGSMGHSSSIALGVAINKPNTRIWCVDGDGAVLMHMGSIAVIGANKPKNLIHVVINNGAHETVGGMPTVAENIDLVKIALACGYPNAVCVDNFDDLDRELEAAKSTNELSLIEVKCSIGAREDLGRPTTTALENKQNFMDYISEL